jgi:hypothetical protein
MRRDASPTREVAVGGRHYHVLRRSGGAAQTQRRGWDQMDTSMNRHGRAGLSFWGFGDIIRDSPQRSRLTSTAVEAAGGTRRKRHRHRSRGGQTREMRIVYISAHPVRHSQPQSNMHI